MEEKYRLQAFEWLAEQVRIFGDVLPRRLLEQGFYLDNQRVTLIGPSGIWKPKIFERVPISITTTYGGPYDDAFTPDNLLQYRYRGTDIYHRDNRGLREAMNKRIPLIYFFGIIPGRYLTVWPVYIIHDNPEKLSFTVAVDDVRSIYTYQAASGQGIEINDDDYAKRKYLTSTIKSRLHQKSFRERVLRAYQEQCAFCRLRHAQLLDAAHIIPDSDEYGDPAVTNGLSLCKIHHAAFDVNIIGVTPDYQIKIREDVLKEKDGPMLKFGIQELQDHKIILPTNRKMWPDQERLLIRYEKFSHVG